MSRILLQVRDLTVGFETENGFVAAVDNVAFDIREGEVLGLVGESGCGKSVTASSLLRLVPSPPAWIKSGEAHFDGADLLKLSIPELRAIRGHRISMIFQEPMTALSPLMPVGLQLKESLQLHTDISDEDAEKITEEWLLKVGLPDPVQAKRQLPHELSGGMRQRVMIAMALMMEPDIIIADEPTTALDVTVQAQIFDLLLKAKSEKSAVLFITHDMGAVWEICDRVLVMYAAQIVEEGSVQDIFERPAHPYTQGLLRAVPTLQARGARLQSIPGQVPQAGSWPVGCRFADRCPLVFDRCRRETPMLEEIGPARKAACFAVEKKGATV